MGKQSNGLPHRVAQDLMQRIMNEEFKQGTVLPTEHELQMQYQVSRPVVREAIKWLDARGVISTNTSQGAVVVTDLISPLADILMLAFQQARVCNEDIIDVRELLEPHIAALAAQNATPPQLRELKDLTDTLSRLSFDGTEEENLRSSERWHTADMRFHVLLAEATQNPVLAILSRIIVGTLWSARSFSTHRDFVPERRNAAKSDHQAIAEAVWARDPDEARQHMLDHMRGIRSNPRLNDSLQDLVKAQDWNQAIVEKRSRK
jgi:DNA-binding FadR family transcriptional regulator